MKTLHYTHIYTKLSAKRFQDQCPRYNTKAPSSEFEQLVTKFEAIIIILVEEWFQKWLFQTILTCK